MADVQVVNPAGELGSIDENDLPSAVNYEGYRQATPDDIKAFNSQKEFGTPGQQARTAAEEAARVLSFGASDYALTKAGVPAREILGRKEENPGSRLIGGAAALIPSMMTGEGEAEAPSILAGAPGLISKLGKGVTESLANPEADTFVGKILNGAVSHGVGSAVEGAAYSTGDLVSEDILGDPNLTSQSALAQLGLGATIGGALGGVLGTTGALYSKVRSELTPEVKQAVLNNSIRDGSAEAMANDSSSFKDFPPGSIEGIMQQTKNKSDLLESGMPSKQMLSDANDMFSDSQYPVHKVQLESLNDPNTRQFYKNLKESNTDTGRALTDYEALQKKEGVNSINDTIQKIAPNTSITGDSTKAFNDLKTDFTQHYNQEKEALEPAFKSFDKAGIKPISDPAAMIGELDKAIPGAADHISYDGESLKLAPYKASMPFSKEAYSAINEVVEGANDPDLTLEGLRNIRKSISDQINWDTNPRVASQLSDIKKSLMDHMINEVSKSEPDLAVRETFKRYAINEQNREALEKVLGGSFSDKGSLGRKISPEDAINHIFSNSNTVEAANNVLGREGFNKALANYLKINIDKVTDNAGIGFSSKKFATFLKTKFPELKEAFKENPEVLARIKAITDKLRILPDAGRANPSESATSLKNMGIIDKIKSIANAGLNPHGFVAEKAMSLFNKFGEMSDNQRLNKVFNFMNEGKSLPEAQELAESKMIHTGVLKKVEDLKNKTTNTIEKGAKAILSPTAIGYSSSRASEYLNDKKSDTSIETYKKRTQEVTNYVNNFDESAQKLEDATSSLYPHAPNISGAMQQTMIKGTQFLASKIPQTPSLGILSTPNEPSEADISKFNKYYDAIQKPLSVFEDIKTQMLSGETVEALQAVYPDLLNKIKTEIVHGIGEAKPSEVPYSTKLQLSLLFGMDMDASMSASNIMANQANFVKGPQPGQGKVTQGGLNKVNMSDRYTTSQNKIANREA